MPPADHLRTGLFVQMMAVHGPRITRALQRRHKGDDEALIRCYQAALGVAVDQPARAHRAVDQITVMECRFGLRATKRLTAAGVDEKFKAGKWFATTTVEAAGIGDLAALLAQIERHPRWFLMRGKLIEGRHPGRVRRLLYPDPKTGDDPYFEECARRWLGLDFDSFDLPGGVSPVDIDAVAALATARLPEAFHRATCWAQLTCGAGIKPGARVRLFYWLGRPVDGAFLERWLKAVPKLDHSLFIANGPHYIARPVIDPGGADPVPVRSRLIAGETDTVTVPRLPPEPERAQARPSMATMPTWWQSGRRARAYAADCLRALEDAPPGQGRSTCTGVALRLYGLCKAGRLDPAEVTGQLKRVMLDRGWGADETTRGMTLADVNRQLEWAWLHASARDLQ